MHATVAPPSTYSRPTACIVGASSLEAMHFPKHQHALGLPESLSLPSHTHTSHAAAAFRTACEREGPCYFAVRLSGAGRSTTSSTYARPHSDVAAALASLVRDWEDPAAAQAMERSRSPETCLGGPRTSFSCAEFLRCADTSGTRRRCFTPDLPQATR